MLRCKIEIMGYAELMAELCGETSAPKKHGDFDDVISDIEENEISEEWKKLTATVSIV